MKQHMQAQGYTVVHPCEVQGIVSHIKTAPARRVLRLLTVPCLLDKTSRHTLSLQFGSDLPLGYGVNQCKDYIVRDIAALMICSVHHIA